MGDSWGNKRENTKTVERILPFLLKENWTISVWWKRIFVWTEAENQPEMWLSPKCPPGDAGTQKKWFQSMRKSLKQVGDSCCLPPLNYQQGSWLPCAIKSLSPGSPSSLSAGTGSFHTPGMFCARWEQCGSSAGVWREHFLWLVKTEHSMDVMCSDSHCHSTAFPWRLFSVKSI